MSRTNNKLRSIKNLLVLLCLLGITLVGFLVYQGVIDRATVQSWFRLSPEPERESIETPDRPPAIDPQQFFSRLSEGIEGFQRLAACARVNTLAVEEQENRSIYRWKDQHGQTHFSDRQPGGLRNSDQMAVYLPDRNAYFRLELIFDTARPPTFIRDRISAEVRQIYDILAKDLSLDHLRKVALKVRIIETQEAFQAYKERVAPELKTRSGFYSSALNEAVVFQDKREEQMYAVIRHEATHVIVAGLYGYTPAWFNEGLAEYFEHLEVAGQMRKVAPVPRHLNILRADLAKGNGINLKEYMRLSPQQWYQGRLDKHYAQAWSLIYFLLSDEQGRSILREVMNQMARNYCWHFSSVDYLEQFYPGGVNGLTSRWQEWLAQPPQPHRY